MSGGYVAPQAVARAVKTRCANFRLRAEKIIDYLNLFSSWALFGISLFEKKNVVGDNGGEP